MAVDTNPSYGIYAFSWSARVLTVDRQTSLKPQSDFLVWARHSTDLARFARSFRIKHLADGYSTDLIQNIIWSLRTKLLSNSEDWRGFQG